MSTSSFRPTAKKLVAAGIAAIGLFGAQASYAAAILNNYLLPGLNGAQDDDRERVLRVTTRTDNIAYTIGGTNYSVVTSGDFQKGDIIQALLRFDSVNGANTSSLPGYGGAVPVKSLTAFSELAIVDIVNSSGTACGPADGVCTLKFGASGNLGANVLAEFYESTIPNPVFPATIWSVAPNTAITNFTATGDTLIAEVGLGEADDFWTANIPAFVPVLGQIGGVAAAANAGSSQAAIGEFGLSILSNPGLIPVVKNGTQSGATGTFHDVVGNASAFRKENTDNAGWLVQSNTSINFTVPEPGTLALLGLVAMSAGGAGVFRRRS